MDFGFQQKTTQSTHPGTLGFSRGCESVKPNSTRGTPKEAVELLDAQNCALKKDRMVELTYGPQRPRVRGFVPEYVKLDNKVLRFEGVVHEEIRDWPSERDRVRLVKLLYFLENDTMKVIEPPVPNSGLYQGTMFQRAKYLHPCNSQFYQWRDLNVGRDVHLFGRTIHLYDCDLWTREYLTEQGVEVGEPEPEPENPILLEREAMRVRNETRPTPKEDLHPSGQFYSRDGQVLRFYGIFKDETETCKDVRRILLKFYLCEGSVEVVENAPPNSGRTKPAAHSREARGGLPVSAEAPGPWMTIVKRQRVLLDREREVEKVPCYLQPTGEDDVVWMGPEHLKTGEDVRILGKTLYLGKCDDFTRQFYRDEFGVDMPQIEVVRKPQMKTPVLVPPHTLGAWEETIEDCFKPHAKMRIRVKKVPLKSKELEGTILRFSAFLDTPRETEQDRSFVISYFPEDDTVKIHEERVPNSGHGSGTFLGRGPLRKDVGRSWEATPALAKGARPLCYGAADFYVGARIRANGSTFVIKDADLKVFDFMEEHPEMYPDICAKEQRELSEFLKGFRKPSHEDRMHLLDEMRDRVVSECGSGVCPWPRTLDLGDGFQRRNVVEEKLHCANLPLPQDLLKKM